MLPEMFFKLRRALTPLMHQDTYDTMNRIVSNIENLNKTKKNSDENYSTKRQKIKVDNNILITNNTTITNEMTVDDIQVDDQLILSNGKRKRIEDDSITNTNTIISNVDVVGNEDVCSLDNSSCANGGGFLCHELM